MAAQENVLLLRAGGGGNLYNTRIKPSSSQLPLLLAPELSPYFALPGLILVLVFLSISWTPFCCWELHPSIT